jgi:hypothetical protein
MGPDMTKNNQWHHLRAAATTKPFPDATRVKVTARLGLQVAESMSWRRPGGRPYAWFSGSQHESSTSTDRQLYNATIEAAETALYRDDDER